MQIYDVLMLLVLFAATLFGLWKGLAWQIASIASLVISYFVALRFSTQLAPTFGDSAPFNRFVAMLVIYIATSLIIWTLFRVVSGMIDRVKLVSFDHQMGALVGLLKGVLFCVAITFFAVTLLPQPQKESILASQSGRYIVALLDRTHTIVPPEIHEVIGPYLHTIAERLDPNYQPAPGHEAFGSNLLDPGLLNVDVGSLWRQDAARPQTPDSRPANGGGPASLAASNTTWPSPQKEVSQTVNRANNLAR
jgi:membrane protein required for colicin V production